MATARLHPEGVPASAPQLPASTSGRRAFQRFCQWYFCTWPIAVALLWQWDALAGIIQFVLTHSVAIYSALRSNSQCFGNVVQSFATTDQEVWLTIDDGPFPGQTPAMLEVLARYQIRATFFLEGQRAVDHPDLVCAITAAGHTIGNHSHTHSIGRFWAADPWSARCEISRCDSALHSATGAHSVGFRPPVGMANGFVHAAARCLGVPVIGWSARGYDGVDHSSARVAERIARRLFPGAILLLHQRECLAGAMPRNVETLQAVLEEIVRQGYRCVLPQAQQLRYGLPPVRLSGRSSLEALVAPASTSCPVQHA